jgi:hypothetical protein
MFVGLRFAPPSEPLRGGFARFASFLESRSCGNPRSLARIRPAEKHKEKRRTIDGPALHS